MRRADSAEYCRRSPQRVSLHSLQVRVQPARAGLLPPSGGAGFAEGQGGAGGQTQGSGAVIPSAGAPKRRVKMILSKIHDRACMKVREESGDLNAESWTPVRVERD